MNTKQITCSNFRGRKLICPWQIVPLMDNFLRPLVHNPRRLFGPYVRTGMMVLDVGCGAGFTSLGLAGLVGKKGLVISADLQPQMLDIVKKRAAKAGLSDRIRTHRCDYDRIRLAAEVDFAVAFFMLHEVPDALAFLAELHGLLKTGGLLFLAEPKIHVRKPEFERVVREAETVGFTLLKRPAVRLGRAVLLGKRVHPKT